MKYELFAGGWKDDKMKEESYHETIESVKARLDALRKFHGKIALIAIWRKADGYFLHLAKQPVDLRGDDIYFRDLGMSQNGHDSGIKG